MFIILPQKFKEDVFFRISTMQDAMINATMHGYKAMLPLLQNFHGIATCDLSHAKGRPAIFFVCENGGDDETAKDALRKLVASDGVTVNCADGHGYTPLHTVFATGDKSRFCITKSFFITI